VGVRVGAVVIDCNDFDRMLAFWRAALGYQPGPVENGFTVMKDPERRGVAVSLQAVPEPRVGKNRLHLDLFARDEEQEAARLVGLGARRVRRSDDPDDVYVVLADPEGNEFCVVRSRG
jgi:catechol 2,3-dioxygenase-like lactoylglutathione lyase family enzyme